MLAGLRQGVRRGQRDRAFEEKRRAEVKTKIVEDIAEVDAVAGAIVGAALGGAPAVIIGVGGDAAAAAAGAFTKSYVEKGKGIKQSLKDAAGRGIVKGAASALLSKVKAGGKGASAVFGYVSGKVVDATMDAVLDNDNSTQNTSRGAIDG